MTILAIDRVTVKRGGRIVIDELSLTAAAGEVLGLVGKNGCGKSTLLLAIAGVLEPSNGRITIDGASVWGSSRERARARASLGFVPEAADPPGFLIAHELWALCAAARGAEPPSPELTAQLGLDEVRDLALDRMSLGQRRRACLGAALLGSPPLLVLDEPNNGLDAHSYDALATAIASHAASGHAAIVSTHDRDLLARVSARVVDLTS